MDSQAIREHYDWLTAWAARIEHSRDEHSKQLKIVKQAIEQTERLLDDLECNIIRSQGGTCE